MIESKRFRINYEIYEDYLNNLIIGLENSIDKVFNFFGIEDLNQKIIINIISSKSKFDEIFYNAHYFKPQLEGVGFYRNNEITYLTYSEFKNANHQQDTYEDYLNILIHECVHFIHAVCNNNRLSLKCINEGLALFLGKQYTGIDYSKFNCNLDDLINEENIDYYNFYLIFNFIYENYDKKTLFKFINNKEYATNNIKEIYNKIRHTKQYSH